MAELLPGLQQEAGRMVQYAARQQGSLARRSYPELHEESDELPPLPGADPGLSEIYLETQERREQLELEDQRMTSVITSFFVVFIFGLLLIVALLRVLSSGRSTDGYPEELSVVEVESYHS